MQVKDIMTRKVEYIYADTPLAKAAEAMRIHDIGTLPVRDGDNLVGMITDRDIKVRATANNFDPEKTKIRAVMTPYIICCFEDQDVNTAGTTMREQQIRRLPVLSRQRNLVGLVSRRDIALGTGDATLAAASIQKVCMPESPKPLPGQKRE